MSLRKHIGVAVAVLAIISSSVVGASSDEQRSWACDGQYFDRSEAMQRAGNFPMSNILIEYAKRWDAIHVREQCEAFAAGRPYEINCLFGRRDWEAIAKMVPQDLWGLPPQKLGQHLTELIQDEDGYGSAVEYCKTVGAIPSNARR